MSFELELSVGWKLYTLIQLSRRKELFYPFFSVQAANGYKCGVCGDNYDKPPPRFGHSLTKFQIFTLTYITLMWLSTHTQYVVLGPRVKKSFQNRPK